MRRLTIVVLLLFTAGSTTAATSWVNDKNWRGSGWYITIFSVMATLGKSNPFSIDKGPFSTEDQCKAAFVSDKEVHNEVPELVFSCDDLRQ